MSGRRPVVAVVGAGSAGSVVAGRLASSGRVSVLLLEAGDDGEPSDVVRGPSFVRAMGEAGLTWVDLPAVRADGQEARRYVRGRGVGGSSLVNAMVALPGHPDDYDEWQTAFGCTGWSWSTVAPWIDEVRRWLPLAPPARTELGALAAAFTEWVPGAELPSLTRGVDGRRVTAADAFLEPWRVSDRLEVRGQSEVSRVVFRGRRACGVEMGDGRVVEADAVIVCAGAIHTPAVLLRSEIAREGVGRGLQDHPSFPLTVAMREPGNAGRAMVSVGALLRGSFREPDDLQVLVMDEVDVAAPGYGALLGAVMRVWSRGVVRLGSDPLGPPDVSFSMLDDERDVDAMQAAVRLVGELSEGPWLRGVATPLPADISDAAVRAAVGDYVHATSTCRMGRVDDPAAVVDERGAVIGHEGLWVMDASVMPRVPRANTHLPTMAVALRLATEWLESEAGGSTPTR